MKADELMIGDWVLDKHGDSIQVREILEDGINGEWDGGECYGVEAHIDEIEPIPIDLDILEKKRMERRCRGKYTLQIAVHTRKKE